MKIKAGNLPINTQECLKELASRPDVLTGAESYKIFKLMKKIESALKDFRDVQQEIIKEYCKKDENGEPVIVENHYQFNNDDINIVNEKIMSMVDETEEIDFDILPDIDQEKLNKLNLNFDTMAFFDTIEKIKLD